MRWEEHWGSITARAASASPSLCRSPSASPPADTAARVYVPTEANQGRSSVTQGGSAISQASSLGLQQDSFGDQMPD